MKINNSYCQNMIVLKHDNYKQYKSYIKALYCYELVKAIEGQDYTYNEHTGRISTKPRPSPSV